MRAESALALVSCALLACGGAPAPVDGGISADAPAIDMALPRDTGAPPVVTFLPAAVSFGVRPLFDTSAPVDALVATTGELDGIELTLAGAGASSFEIVSTTCGARLAAGATCSVRLAFTPRSSAHLAATLTLRATGVTASLPLAGDGVRGGDLSVSPTPFDFGLVDLGSSSAVQVFHVLNPASATSGALSTRIDGMHASEFAIVADGCAGAVLADSASCTVAVVFTPGGPGFRNAQLTVTASPGGTASAALAGRAPGCGASDGALTLTPASIGFGAVAVGASSTNVNVTLTNRGPVATATVSTALTGADAAEIAIVSDACRRAPLNGGATCTITLQFSPTASAAAHASLEVTAGPAKVCIPLAGSGT